MIVAEYLNSHFANITNSLGVDQIYKDDTACLDLDFKTGSAVVKYKEHQNIVNINSKAAFVTTVHLEHEHPWDVMSHIYVLDPNKNTNKNIHMTKDILCP